MLPRQERKLIAILLGNVIKLPYKLDDDEEQEEE
jgi:hypothetical protein